MALYSDIVLPVGFLLGRQVDGNNQLSTSSNGYSKYLILLTYSICNNYSYFDLIVTKSSDTIEIVVGGTLLYLIKESNIIAKQDFIS